MKLKSLLFLCFASAIAFSCSDDPEETYTPPVTLPMATHIQTTGSSNHGYSFAYDVWRRISKMTVTGGETTVYSFSYNEDNLISKVVIDGATDRTLMLTYNEDNQYTGFTSATGNGEATYDEATKVYRVKTAYNRWFQVKTDADYDLTMLHSEHEDLTLDFKYDGTKGPFHNAGGNIHFVMALLRADFIYVTSKKMPSRIATIDNPDFVTYDSLTYDGFVTETDVFSEDLNMDYSINYDYNWK